MRAIDSLVEANELLQFILDRLNQLASTSQLIVQATSQGTGGLPGEVDLAQARIDNALADIGKLTNESYQSSRLLRGGAEITTTLRSHAFVLESQVFRANLEATGDLKAHVEVHEPATQAELILFASAFEGPRGANPKQLTLRDKVVLELNSHQASEMFTFNAGTSALQILATINLFSDITGIEASFLRDSMVLQTQDFGSQAFVELSVLDEGGASNLTDNLSVTRAHGADIQASVNGVPAYGDGNRINVYTEQLALEVVLENEFCGAFDFRITGGGVLFNLSGKNMRIGFNSLSPTQLGTYKGRLFELGAGQSRCLAEHPIGARTIARGVQRALLNLRERICDFQEMLLEDAQRQYRGAHAVANANFADLDPTPVPFGERRLPTKPKRRSPATSMFVHAGPSILDVEELSTTELETFLRR